MKQLEEVQDDPAVEENLVSCCIASPIELSLGNTSYVSGGMPPINDVRFVRRDNVCPPPRVPQRKRLQASAEVTYLQR